MVRMFVFLAAAQLVLLVLAMISCLAADRVRTMHRALWVLVIVLIPLLGPLAYFFFGRPTPPPTENSPARRRAPRPSSPDDDPDFLRKVDTEQARRDRELLDSWERDIQQRNGEDQPPRPPATGA